jgi:iron complex outermembrane recepter protein
MNCKPLTRTSLLGCSALATLALLPGQALAQQSVDNIGLEEIIVTAQKREQSVQDVPIAVTAVSEETLQANRITTVGDLSAVAPGVIVRPSAGGISTPAFTIRGQVSFGVVAGSDKQVSIYLDGVYLSNPRGSIFELPDIQRLEVLRGPQGTLFGRNATAGAVSITTRDPSGDARVKIEGTVGNLDAYRIRATVETPEFGPFSAYFSYLRNSRRGDIRNALGGTVWDRTLSTDRRFAKRTQAANYLGNVDSHSFFAAVKFEPSDSFKIIYKFDRTDDNGSPEGNGFIGWDRALGGGLAGNVLTALYTSQPTFLQPDGKRPDVVSNGWVIPREQRVQGHSLTATWQASDSITVKNILAFRKSYVFAASAIDGVSSLTFTQPTANALAFLFAASTPGFFTFPAAVQAGILANISANVTNPLVGGRVLPIASQSSSVGEQWSNELQVNYTSDKLNATLGAMWFQSDDQAGGPEGLRNTYSFNFSPSAVFPASGVLPLRDEGRYFNKATSLAAYAQLEYKLTPQLVVVGGARVTHDKKTSRFRWNVAGVPRPTIVPPEYKNTKPNFLVGLNWTPNDNTLVYAKWSNSFVSGGSTAGIEYLPETASSFEVGLKADFLDRRLRTNLALYHVDYKHFQSPGSTTTAESAATILPTLIALYGATTANELLGSLSTYVVDQGTVRAKGFELEVTALPARGLIIGGNLGYTDVSYPFVTPDVLAGNGGTLRPTTRPKWTGSVYASYETPPLFGEATLNLRMDAMNRGRLNHDSNNRFLYADRSNASVQNVPGFWMINGRAALRNFDLGGVKAELAVWGKNITNRRDVTFVLATPLATTANYVTARTFGIDLGIEF